MMMKSNFFKAVTPFLDTYILQPFITTFFIMNQNELIFNYLFLRLISYYFFLLSLFPTKLKKAENTEQC
jgi:hypothetical protein